jgi:predicted dehydrogenase
MAERVRLGVIGCGVVALDDYFPVLAREDVQQQMELVSVCDVAVDRARDVAGRFGAKEWYGGYEDLLERSPVDAIAILTPIPTHFPIAMAALEAGKHVYVQKTMTTSVAEADVLIAAARERGVKLAASPGQMLDWAHRETKSLIEQGALGKVSMARGHGPHYGHEAGHLHGINPSWYYKRGGGPVMDVGVYPLHSLTGIMGPARRVTAFSAIAVRERQWEGQPIEVEIDDNTALLLDQGEGRLSLISATYCARRWNVPQFEFYGTHGVAYIGGWTRPTPPLEIYTESPIAGFNSGWYAPTTPIGTKPAPLTKPTAGDLLHFIDCLANDAQPIPSAEHARHVIEIIEKGYEAARTGQAQELTTTF